MHGRLVFCNVNYESLIYLIGGFNALVNAQKTEAAGFGTVTLHFLVFNRIGFHNQP